MTTTSAPGSARGPAAIDAFVSYAREDAGAVMAVVGALRGQGRRIWIDADEIPPAAEWRVELGTALEAADAVLCCLSPDWLASRECRREYDRAVELGKRLVPVLVRMVATPPPALAALQWIDARRTPDDRVAAAVVHALDVDPERVREHTHWLLRALRWDARGRDGSLLLRGRDLRAAEEWLAKGGTEPSPVPVQNAHVAASRTAELRRVRRTIGLVSVTLVVTIALAATAMFQWAQAVDQRGRAESRALASAAQSQLDIDPERSLLLASAAWSRAPTGQAAAALRAAVPRSRVRLNVAAHAAPCSGAVWSRDGRTLVTAAGDGILKAWDGVTGALRDELDLRAGAVQRIVGTSIGGVAVTEQGRAVMWALDSMTGTLTLGAVLATSGVTTAAAVPESVAIGMADGSVRMWDGVGRTGVESRWARSPVRSLALSADGTRLLVGTEDGMVLTGSPGQDPPRAVTRLGSAVSTAQLSSDGSTALVAADNAAATVHATADGRQLVALPATLHAALDPSGRRAVVAQVDGTIVIQPFEKDPPARSTSALFPGLTPQPAGRITLTTSGTTTSGLGFTVDGTQVVAAGLDGSARVWASASGAPLLDLRGASVATRVFAPSPDGGLLATGHADGTVRSWAMPDRPVALGTQDDRILASMSDVAFSPDGSTLLTAARSGLARTWDTRTGREAATGTGCSRPPLEPACLAARTLDAHGGGALTRAAYSPNGRLAATSSVQGSLVIWDMATAERVSRPADVPRPVDDIAFSPDGTRLATAERDGTTRLLDPATGALVREFRDPDGRSTEAVAFGAGGDLMTANEGGLVRRWDGAGHPRVLADVHEKVLRLALDPTGRLVALGTTSRIVLVDLADGHTVHTLLGHSGLVTGVGFTPDGALLVSGGKDGTVRVWDAESGDQAAQFAVPGGGVSQLAVDVAGRRIAVVTDRGSGAVIDCEACRSPADLARLADVRATRDLTDEERANFDAS